MSQKSSLPQAAKSVSQVLMSDSRQSGWQAARLGEHLIAGRRSGRVAGEPPLAAATWRYVGRLLPQQMLAEQKLQLTFPSRRNPSPPRAWKLAHLVRSPRNSSRT